MLKLSASIAMAALVATGAQAATHRYNIGFTSLLGQPFQTGTGTLYTSDTLNASGGYDVVGVEGVVSAPGEDGAPGFAAIAGLSNFEGADNVLYPASPNVDGAGLGFVSASGGVYDLHLAQPTVAAFAVPAQAGDYQYVLDYAASAGGPVTRSYVQIALTEVATSAAPEPGVWLLMMAGVGLAGAALRRRAFATA